MRILLSNDDGIHSPCLRALHDALCEAGHELDVVAPLTEQSGVGCSVTLHNPLRLYPVQEPGFSGTAVAGTPVDCVKLALTTLLPQPPDLVVVGINNGANKGVDVFYSGTVGAATEAALRGLPAVYLLKLSINFNIGIIRSDVHKLTYVLTALSNCNILEQLTNLIKEHNRNCFCKITIIYKCNYNCTYSCNCHKEILIKYLSVKNSLNCFP